MLLKPILAIAVLVTGVVIYGVLPAALSNPYPESLRPFSDGFNNMSGFKDAVESLSVQVAPGRNEPDYKVNTLVGSPTVLSGISNPSRTVYFAAGISREYRTEEVNALEDFVRGGGKIIIADDFGYPNSLAQRFGIFYFGSDVWDLEDGRYDKNISLPLVPFTFAGTDYTIELNQPTGITVIQNPLVNTTVIAHCSEKCYADIDRNHQVNIGDKKGNITMIMRAQLLQNITLLNVTVTVETPGEAYFIADASIFTNDLLDKHDNQAFAKALISTLLPAGGTVVIDESRHLHAPGTQVVYSSFETAAVATSKAELASALIGGAALVLAIVVFRAKDRESWIHKFDLSTFHPRRELPETLMVQLERLRRAARLKVQMTYSLSDEEFAFVPPDQLRTMIREPLLVELILNPARPWAAEELHGLATTIRAWGK